MSCKGTKLPTKEIKTSQRKPQLGGVAFWGTRLKTSFTRWKQLLLSCPCSSGPAGLIPAVLSDISPPSSPGSLLQSSAHCNSGRCRMQGMDKLSRAKPNPSLSTVLKKTPDPGMKIRVQTNVTLTVTLTEIRNQARGPANDIK